MRVRVTAHLADEVCADAGLPDPRNVLGVIRLSRASYRKMIQNLAWGAG